MALRIGINGDGLLTSEEFVRYQASQPAPTKVAAPPPISPKNDPNRIAAEKTLPWRRPVTYATALVLVALALLLVLVPGSLPGLTIPGSGGMMGMAP